MAEVVVRVAGPGDAAEVRALRLRALTEEPKAFTMSAEAEAERTDADYRERLAGPWAQVDNRVLGAWVDGALMGMIGWFRQPHTKVQHRLTIWGVYVAPEARGQRVGDALMEAALTHIRAIPEATDVHLAVGMYNRSARALYERHGFVTWGVEPRAIRVGDQWIDEAYMNCALRS